MCAVLFLMVSLAVPGQCKRAAVETRHASGCAESYRAAFIVEHHYCREKMLLNTACMQLNSCF
jgi:hypothetical protein